MKWLQAVSIISSAKKGVSSLQLARTIGVNKNTAWYMQKRLRHAMSEDPTLILGLVEIDETYIGGALANMSREKKKKRNPYRSGMIHKTPVLGIIERHKGTTYLERLDHACGKTIKPILKKRIAPKSKVVTDGFGAYYGIGGHFDKHIKTNAEKEQRAWGRYHINTVEGFFSMIKRAVIGQYHQLSVRHLQGYLDEISFKKNHGDNVFQAMLVAACAG
jgi:transposase-like protein